MLKIEATTTAFAQQRGSVATVLVSTPDRYEPLEIVVFSNKPALQQLLASLKVGTKLTAHGKIREDAKYGTTFIAEDLTIQTVTETKTDPLPVFFNAEETRYDYTLAEIVENQIPRPKAKYYKAFNAPSWEHSEGYFYMTTLEREKQRASYFNLPAPYFTKRETIESLPDGGTLLVSIDNNQLGVLKTNGTHPYSEASTDSMYKAIQPLKAELKVGSPEF